MDDRVENRLENGYGFFVRIDVGLYPGCRYGQSVTALIFAEFHLPNQRTSVYENHENQINIIAIQIYFVLSAQLKLKKLILIFIYL